MKILREVPGSRLLLQAPAGRARQRVIDRFVAGGIAKERLEFVGMQGWEGYLESLSRLDVALDPFPYGGGITSCDAIWMGVPVVTLSGETAVGRGGRSILSNIGLPELVAETPEEYVKKPSPWPAICRGSLNCAQLCVSAWSAHRCGMRSGTRAKSRPPFAKCGATGAWNPHPREALQCR